MIGYAATRASWDALHVADTCPNIVPGIAYNLFHDPNRDGIIDKCSTVQWNDGAVTGYQISVTNGTKLKAAMLQALLEVPRDFKKILLTPTPTLERLKLQAHR